MSFGMFRGIWISLRAVNYTTTAFADIGRSLGLLNTQEIQLLQMSKALIQVGVIFMAMGYMAVMAIQSMINQSQYGAKMMQQFQQSVNNSIGKIGEQLARILEPVLNTVAKILDIIASNPVLAKLAAWFIIVVTAALLLIGAFLILKGVLLMLQLPLLNIIASLFVTKGGMDATTTSAASLGVASEGASVGVSTLSTSLMVMSVVAMGAIGVLQTLQAAMDLIKGKGTGSDWGKIIGGIAGAAVGFAVGGPLGAMAGFGVGTMAGGAIGGAFQMGTSFVKKGGLALVETGEKITSAREYQPEKASTTRNTQNITIHIGNVHTKASAEELIPLVRKELRRAIQSK